MSFALDTNKRKVSLGGRSRVAESREQLLKRSQEERERRALERLQAKSILIIQAGFPVCTSCPLQSQQDDL